jgi:hypothetical protein
MVHMKTRGGKILSKEQKLLKLEAIKERKRRLKKNRPQYVPHSGQRRAHISKAKDRFVFSSNSWGKSCFAVQETIWAAKGYNPVTEEYSIVPAKVIVVLDSPSKVEEVWLREIEKWYDTSDWLFEKEGRPYISKITLPNGSTIRFLFALQDPLAFESIEVDFVVIDEPIPRRIYIALKRGGRTKGRKARYLMIMTPIAAPWLRTDIFEPWAKGLLPDVECFRGEIYEKEIRLKGSFFDVGDLALAHLFKHDTHVIPIETFNETFDKSNPCVLAIDPHSSKPHVACLLGCDRENNLYYIKEISRKKVAREFAKELKDFMKGYRVIDIVMDSAGTAESTGGEGYKSFHDIMREEGVMVRPTSFKDKSDEDFIDRARSILAIPEEPDNYGFYLPVLRIVEGNAGIIKNIENVGFQKHRDLDVLKPKLDIREHDYLACLKYALASGLHIKKEKSKVHTPRKALYGFGGKKRRF